MKLIKTEQFDFTYETEVEQLEWEIRYSKHRLNAAKKYLDELKKFGTDINKIDAQRIRSEYDKDLVNI